MNERGRRSSGASGGHEGEGAGARETSQRCGPRFAPWPEPILNATKAGYSEGGRGAEAEGAKRSPQAGTAQFRALFVAGARDFSVVDSGKEFMNVVSDLFLLEGNRGQNHFARGSPLAALATSRRPFMRQRRRVAIEPYRGADVKFRPQDRSPCGYQDRRVPCQVRQSQSAFDLTKGHVRAYLVSPAQPTSPPC
jgi:hypothetical protein